MTPLAQLGLRAGAAGWKAGHLAVQSGTLDVLGVPESDRRGVISQAAAQKAGPYMDDIVAHEHLTPAQGVRLWFAYMGAFINGALDQALDGGALYRSDP